MFGCFVWFDISFPRLPSNITGCRARTRDATCVYTCAQTCVQTCVPTSVRHASRAIGKFSSRIFFEHADGDRRGAATHPTAASERPRRDVSLGTFLIGPRPVGVRRRHTLRYMRADIRSACAAHHQAALIEAVKTSAGTSMRALDMPSAMAEIDRCSDV